MGKRRKPPKRMLTLEEQLREHDATAPVGCGWDGMGQPIPDAKRLAWARRRIELLDAIQHRDSKRLADPGRDASGNFTPSPYAMRGHLIEVAPKELRSTPDSTFPKRVATQRMIDRYKARKLITPAQWQAADAMWQCWCALGLGARVVSNYTPDQVSRSADIDGLIARRMDSIIGWLDLIACIPYRSRGVVTSVVILDSSASDWARLRGFRGRDSERHGLDRLRPGLQALADDFGY